MTLELASPRRFSPLHYQHLRAGASMEEYQGWQRPAYYVEPASEASVARDGVGMLDESWLGKLSVRGELVSMLLEACWPGTDVPPLRVAAPGAATPLVARLTGDEALVLTSAETRLATMARLEEQCQALGGCVHVLDLSGAQAALLLVGPSAHQVLRKATALDVRESQLPNLACAQASVARVHATVMRDDLSDLTAYRVLFSRDYAPFVWEWLVEVGHEFGLIPLGSAALDLLRGHARAAGEVRP